MYVIKSVKEMAAIMFAMLAIACTSDGTLTNNLFSVVERATECKQFDADFSEAYTAVVISDLHFGGDRKRLPEKYYQWLDEIPQDQKPRLCLVLGDIANKGLQSEYELYNAFIQDMRARGMEVYGVLGNHDVFESGDFGRNYLSSVEPHAACYSVRTPRLSYYFIDTADNFVGQSQYFALESHVKADSNPKIILSHAPLYAPTSLYYRMKNSVEQARLLSLFSKNNVRLFLCGHLHEHHRYDMGAFEEIIVSTVKDGSWGILTIDEFDGKFQYEHISPKN
ncbi:MAG: metallophosphoesterase [Treponema sp.]|nr:metallophosphoesterase [Treponema sp.]